MSEAVNKETQGDNQAKGSNAVARLKDVGDKIKNASSASQGYLRNASEMHQKALEAFSDNGVVGGFFSKYVASEKLRYASLVMLFCIVASLVGGSLPFLKTLAFVFALAFVAGEVISAFFKKPPGREDRSENK